MSARFKSARLILQIINDQGVSIYADDATCLKKSRARRKGKTMHSQRSKTFIITALLFIGCTLFNIGTGALFSALKLDLMFDEAGTVFIAMCGNPLAAVAVAFVSRAFEGFFDNNLSERPSGRRHDAHEHQREHARSR